jgi:hypothetical protein
VEKSESVHNGKKNVKSDQQGSEHNQCTPNKPQKELPGLRVTNAHQTKPNKLLPG